MARDSSERHSERGAALGSISWLIFLAGVYAIVSPWIWDYAGVASVPMWNSIISGIVLVLFSIWAAFSLSSWPIWWTLTVGIWLVIAPRVISYAGAPQAARNDFWVGLVVIVLSILNGLTKPDVGYRRDYGPPRRTYR